MYNTRNILGLDPGIKHGTWAFELEQLSLFPL